MSKTGQTPTLKILDHRQAVVEQILPTLATKEDLRRAIEPLATKEQLREAIDQAAAPLATKAEMRSEGERTRRHFDVVAESLRSEIRLIAEGHVHVSQRMDASEARTAQTIASLDRRVTRLETRRGK